MWNMFAASAYTRAGCSLQKQFGHVVQLTKRFDTKNAFEMFKLVKLPQSIPGHGIVLGDALSSWQGGPPVFSQEAGAILS